MILAGHSGLAAAGAAASCQMALADGEAVTGPDDQALAVKVSGLGPRPPPSGRAGPRLLADHTLLLLEAGAALLLLMLLAAAAEAGRHLLLEGSLGPLLLESCGSLLLLLRRRRRRPRRLGRHGLAALPPRLRVGRVGPPLVVGIGS